MKPKISELSSSVFQMIKGVILGILLFVALAELSITATGAALFRYQGF
jgi:hypothetical protein